jgi:hypothetical protein
VDDRSTDLRVDWRIPAGVAAALVLLFTAQNFLESPVIRAGASFERPLQLQIITWGSRLALSPGIYLPRIPIATNQRPRISPARVTCIASSR